VGAVLLGVVAGKVIAEDVWLRGLAEGTVPHTEMRYSLMVAGGAIVAIVAFILQYARAETYDPDPQEDGL
jgi:hypothetical protein